VKERAAVTMMSGAEMRKMLTPAALRAVSSFARAIVPRVTIAATRQAIGVTIFSIPGVKYARYLNAIDIGWFASETASIRLWASTIS
jgi:hypothetical protein